jgi:hypothetical protein
MLSCGGGSAEIGCRMQLHRLVGLQKSTSRASHGCRLLLSQSRGRWRHPSYSSVMGLEIRVPSTSMRLSGRMQHPSTPIPRLYDLGRPRGLTESAQVLMSLFLKDSLHGGHVEFSTVTSTRAIRYLSAEQIVVVLAGPMHTVWSPLLLLQILLSLARFQTIIPDVTSTIDPA